MATTGNDIEIIQNTSASVVSGGLGDDTYIISGTTLGGGKSIQITDTQGANSLQLVGGLQIASTMVAADALQITLTNGSTITIMGAAGFTFEAGGNIVAGINNPDVSYSAFVAARLGTSVPTTGVNTGGAVTIPTAVASAIEAVIVPVLGTPGDTAPVVFIG